MVRKPLDADTPFDALAARELGAVIPDPLIVFDARGAAIYANPAATLAFGQIPRGTVLAHKFRTPEMQKLFDNLLRQGRSGEIDYHERVPIERVFKVSAMAIAGGELFAIHFRDQSETLRIDRMRADFIANASHELRTPLASISGFIETLRGPARNDEKAREAFLQIMQTQTARMARLIDDLLSLSRIEMKPFARSSEKIELVSLVSGIVETLGHVASEHDVIIEFAAPDRPINIPGNRDELTQVFVNLTENACKYGQSGGKVDITISESGSGPSPEIAVTIRDYGPGIPAEHIPRITERFYRVDDSNGVKNGTGLGLAIVKHILTRHDGRLSIRSKIGEGSAFTAHLPLN